MRKNGWVDISVTIKSGMVHWPGDPAVNISRRQDMDKGDSDNVSLISMGSHTGTHMDAPRHFFVRGKGLDKMPLSAVIGPARVLAIINTRCITVPELKRHRIKFGERILFKTRNSSFWKTNVFQKEFVYVTQEAAEYLSDVGVAVVGVDYLSVGGYKKDGAKTHKTILGGGIWIIEGLNLYGIKPGDYDLICLPIKIFNLDGAPARAIIRPRLG
ncbi:MAG: arylformamidase [Candidatus Omnitrophica bacterium CG_4_10_14_0_2_um_filter_44_9]|nr:MAG: arylformamidase [Candidatus Omnitrophica bacterium CG_4_10_14_0_8_um_filter_44_12]PIZ84948.1 MAG: arylformamidase [Candidatus Omnitrophica bacterium CG_4_10_14_0_2_um_filter_44_9]